MFDIAAYVNNIEDGLHSEIGASGAKRWMSCPGSVALARSCAKPEASKYAIEGTRAHRVAELILTGKAEPWEFIGVENVTDEMLDGAVMFADFVRGLAEPGDELFAEREFHLPTIHPDAFGTADGVVLKLDELHIVDFKFGAGVPVEAEENPQLIYYALGAMTLLSDAAAASLKSVHLWIVQPRAAHSAGPIRHWETTYGVLLGWLDKFQAAVAECFGENPRLAKGEWCRWCPALLACPEQRAMQIAEAKADFTRVGVTLPAPIGLTPAQVAAILEQKPVVEAWLKQVAEYAQAELESGHDIPGFKVVNGRGSRAWADRAEAERFLTAALGEKAFSRDLISLAQAEKAKVKIPEHMVRYSVGAAVLAPATDKRAARARDASADFSAVATSTPSDY